MPCRSSSAACAWRLRSTSGTAPLAFLIGANSLGSLIFPGIALNNQPQLVLGAACTALLALLLDGAVTAGSRLWLARRGCVEPRDERICMKKSCTVMGSRSCCPLLFRRAFGECGDSRHRRAGFTEQTMLAEITAQYLRDKGYRFDAPAALAATWRAVRRKTASWTCCGNTPACRARLQPCQRKARQRRPLPAREGTRRQKRPGLADASKLNNTYALALPEQVGAANRHSHDFATRREAHGRADKKHMFAMDTEFANRSDGLVGWKHLRHGPQPRENAPDGPGPRLHRAA